MKTPIRRLMVLFLTVALIAALSGCGSGNGATLTVNTSDDMDDGSCNATHCSLREAIHKANALTSVTTINFDVGGGGVQTISPLEPLPGLSSIVVIDGTSQPGFASTPLIELDGNLIDDQLADGLVINGASNFVYSLAINNFNGWGIRLNGPGDNHIYGCVIGTDVTGTIAKPNGSGGILISSGSLNSIGATLTAQGGNVISGNQGNGIQIQANNTTLSGNFIGVAAGGGSALPNNGAGIWVEGKKNEIGGYDGNVISGNAGAGIALEKQATGNTVKDNKIGTDRTGAFPLGNGLSGIVLNGGYNTVGGYYMSEGNVISANGENGVLIDAMSEHNIVQGNYIGTNKGGTSALGNHAAGIRVRGNANQIGGTLLQYGNLISGNDGNGVTVDGRHNNIQGNLIGTDGTGTAAIGNGGDGVGVYGELNLVGGGESSEGNIISGNDDNGVHITGHGAVVKQNYIGTDVQGMAALGNGENGIYLFVADGVLIGGAKSADRNVVSANGRAGISIGLSSDGVSVFGNYIGTDKTGKGALGNVEAGITVLGVNHQIGSSQEGTGNLISGNLGPGITIIKGATGVTVRNNYIGTDKTGTAALGNAIGVDVYTVSGAGDVTIGGTPVGEGNLISGNDGEGLRTYGGSTVLGNRIGTDSFGSAPLGNGANGILITGPGNQIGAPGFPNTIAHNGGHGVAVISQGGVAMENPILSNSIHDNGGLGIAIDEDGVIPNDSLDPDAGDNNRQNYPLLQGAVSDSAAMETTVSGILNSTPGSTFTVEFFINDACDPSGYGEGQRRVKQITVTTDMNGNAGLTTVLPGVTLSAAGFITATATDSAGNTSGFSNCVEVTEEDAAPETRAMTFTPSVDPDKIFFGRGCSPNQVRIGVEIANPTEPIHYVLLFVRLMDPKTEAKSDWGGGLTMLSSGKNTYVYDLLAEDIPHYQDFPDAVLQYQFVAYDKAQEAIGRSEVYGDILFKRCG